MQHHETSFFSEGDKALGQGRFDPEDIKKGWPFTITIGKDEIASNLRMYLSEQNFIVLKNAILQADQQADKYRKETYAKQHKGH
jgi:hypothetical protein